MTSEPTPGDGPDTRIAGAVLIGASVLGLLAMALHPVGGGGHDPAGSMAHGVHAAHMAHGAMIGLIAAVSFGLTSLARRLDLDRAAPLAGLIAWVFGVGGALIAPIDGLGVIGVSAAIALWSIELVRRRGAARWTGALGLLAGAVASAGLFLHGGHMHGPQATAIFATWSLWFVAAGVLMVRRRL